MVFIYFDRLSSQVQIENKRTPFTVNKLITVPTSLFNYQRNNYDLIISTANSQSRCKDDEDYLIDKDSWSKMFEETSLDYDVKVDKLKLESHTLPCLHSDGSRKPTLNYPYKIVWFPDEVYLIFRNPTLLNNCLNCKLITSNKLMFLSVLL